MDIQNDPELEQLFQAELDERAESLASGARAMAADELTPDLAGKMVREGHTIKGTGRVMGYEAIARGGETCEMVWRWVHQGDLAPSSMLARTLEHLAQAIPAALAGNRHDIAVAMDTVGALIRDPELAGQLPEPIEDDAPSGETTRDEEAPAAPEVPVSEESPIAEDDEGAVAAAGADDDTGSAPEPALLEPTAAGDPDDADADDDADDDVSATLDQIEREIDAGRRADVEATIDLSEVVVEVVEEPAGSGQPPVDPASAGGDEPAVADAPAEEPERDATVPTSEERAEEPVPPPAEADTTAGRGDASARTPGDPDDDGPLVFEPGPDGKLPTPVITYEIVSSAFADVPAPSEPSEQPARHDEPRSLTVVEDQPSILDPANGAVYDLGGLVGAVETWASEESVPVNAGRLFRMINDVAAIRIDLESAMALAAHLLQTAEGISAAAMESALESLETVRRASVNLESAALGLTSMPLAGVTSTLPQLTKYLSKKVDRTVELVVEGEDTLVDRQLVDRVGEVIRQLVVNAVAHGIEPAPDRTAAGKNAVGTVKVSLSRNEEHLQIVVADDGSGIDWKQVREEAVSQGLVGDDPTTEELRGVLYTKGFSTSPGLTEFTGDGEGLARVTDIVEQVFGTMTLDSTPGLGTTFVVTLPAHRALQSAQIFTAGERSWGIPASSVVEIRSLPEVPIQVNERGSFISHGKEPVPYSSFSTVVGLDVEGLPSQVMVIQSPTGLIALAVDDVVELRQVATKDLGPLLSGSSSVVSGVALLGGDEIVMLVDAGRLAEKMRELEARPEGPVHSVLVVDDSQGVRQVVSGVLASHGFSTLSAGSVSDALAVLAKHQVDALVVDFSMPRADGVALIHMVRQRYGDIPVVMLSGVASDEDRTRAERAGADAFFDKADFAKGALVEKLRELIAAPASEAGMAS